MFIDKDQKRANYYVICNLPDAQGTKWPHPLTPAQLAELGYTEIPDPVPPTPPEGFTVEEAFFYNELNDAPYAEWTLKAPEQLKQLWNDKLQAQIDALERQALQDGLVRTLIDDLLKRSLDLAHQAGLSEADLLTPTSPSFSRAYEKVHNNKVARDVLRSQKK